MGRVSNLMPYERNQGSSQAGERKEATRHSSFRDNRPTSTSIIQPHNNQSGQSCHRCKASQIHRVLYEYEEKTKSINPSKSKLTGDPSPRVECEHAVQQVERPVRGLGDDRPPRLLLTARQRPHEVARVGARHERELHVRGRAQHLRMTSLTLDDVTDNR